MSIANPIDRSTFKELQDTAGDEFVAEQALHHG